MNQKKIVRRYAKGHEGLIVLRVVSGGGIEFPVYLFVFTALQYEMTSRLKANLSSARYTTVDICRWARAHGIRYRIYVSPFDRLMPWRIFNYLWITRSL